MAYEIEFVSRKEALDLIKPLDFNPEWHKERVAHAIVKDGDIKISHDGKEAIVSPAFILKETQAYNWEGLKDELEVIVNSDKTGIILSLVARDIENGSRTKPTKLFAKYYKEVEGEKLSQETLSKVGQAFSYYLKDTSGQMYLGFFVSKIFWNPGDFGDDGSCYWGTYKGARLGIDDDLNSGSIVIYKIIGKTALSMFRCHWHNGRAGKETTPGELIEWDKPLVLFNGYKKDGDLSTVKLASLFARALKLKNGRAGILNYGRSPNEAVYINGDHFYINEDDEIYFGKGAVVSFTDYMKKMRDIESEEKGIVLNIRIEYLDGVVCEGCGYTYDEDDVWYIDDQTLCENCARMSYTACYDCGDWVSNDEIVETNDGFYLCDHCANHYTCDICGELQYHYTYNNGKRLCDSCHQALLERKKEDV